jgi:hypothetical protein
MAETELPVGADSAHWIETDAHGTDGQGTYRRTARQGKDADGQDVTVWVWELMARSAARFTADRHPAADPDFPDRTEDAAEAADGSSDVVVTWPEGGKVGERRFRDMPAAELVKARYLKLAGRRATLGMRKVSDSAFGDLYAAHNDLSSAYEVPSEVFHTVTGWHGTDTDMPFFVTGGGAIDFTGMRDDIVSRVDDRLRVYSPASAPIGPDLIDSFECVMALISNESAEPRALVPLIAARLRAVFGVYRDPAAAEAEATAAPTLWITGGTGNGKSGLQAATGNVTGPGLQYNALPFKAGGSNNGGVSISAMEDVTFRARDLAVDFDDLDPGEPEDKRAAWQNALIRRAADQKSRTMARRDGTSRAGKPCRSAVVGSGEPVDAEQSAENRAINIEIGPGDVRRGTLREMTGSADRAIRSGLGGGLIRTLSGDLAGWRSRRTAAARALRPLFATGEVPGPVDRGADSMAELAGTCWVVLQIMVGNGMSRADARKHWAVIRRALIDAWRVHLGVIAAGSRAARAIDLIGEGLASGRLVIASAERPGQAPADLRYAAGWRKDMLGVAEPRGKVSGYVDDRPGSETGDLWLLPTETAATVQRMVKDSGGNWSGGVKALAQDLARERGQGKSELDKNLTDRPYTGDGVRRRVWTVLAATISAEGPDGVTARDYGGPIDTAELAGADLELAGELAAAVDSGDAERVMAAIDAMAEAGLLELSDVEIMALIDSTAAKGKAVTVTPAPAASAELVMAATAPTLTEADPVDKPVTESAPTATVPAPRAEAPAQAQSGPSWPRKAPRGTGGPRSVPQAATVAYRAALAVIDGDGTVHYPDGTSENHPPFTTLAEVIEWTAAARLGVARRFARDVNAMAWLTPAAAERLGIPASAPAVWIESHPALESAASAGWQVGKVSPTMTARFDHPDDTRTYIKVGLAGWISERDAPLFAGVGSGATSAAELAARLGAHIDHLGAPFVVSSGATAQDALRLSRPGGRGKKVEIIPGAAKSGAYAKREAPAARACTVDGILWKRRPSESESAMRYLVGLDANGQFMATMGMVEVGLGSARIIDGPIPFEGLPGYYLGQVPETEWGLPGFHVAGAGEHWIPAPIVAEILECGLPFEPQAAQVYDEKSRYLDKLQRQLRTARIEMEKRAGDTVADALGKQIKAEYSSLTASFASESYRGSEFYYPHWRHHVIGIAEAATRRKLRKIAEVTGKRPIAVYRDAAVYASDDPNPEALLAGTGIKLHPTELGAFKPQGVAPMADASALFVKGSAGQLCEFVKNYGKE